MKRKGKMMFFRWGPYYEQDCQNPQYVQQVREIDAYQLRVRAEQRAQYVQSFIRTSLPGTETTGGYYECTHCHQRTPYQAGSILHTPLCPLGHW